MAKSKKYSTVIRYGAADTVIEWQGNKISLVAAKDEDLTKMAEGLAKVKRDELG